MFPFFVSTFEALFQRNVRAHVLLVLEINCDIFRMLVHGVPVTCLSGCVSIGFPHARLSLRVVTGSDNSPNFLE